MKALITGGAGFIGSHLAEELLKRGDKVSVIDDLSTGKMTNILHLVESTNFSYTIASILNKGDMEKLIDDCDVIYHLAAAVGVKLIMDQPLKSILTNVRGSEIVLELACRANKKVIVASTSEIYGKNGKVPYREDDERVLGSTTITRWNYSTTKALDEILALAYQSEMGLPMVIVRFFNTCGPRQTGQYGMVVPRFIKQALSEKPITVYGDGSATRCFAYVGDIVEALITLANCPKAERQIFNLGNDQEVSIINLAKKIKDLTKSNSIIEFIPYEKVYPEGFEDMERRVPDLTKIRKLIGYSPKVNLDEMLTIIIDYLKEKELKSAA